MSEDINIGEITEALNGKVDISGIQTIGGVKTFENAPIVPNSDGVGTALNTAGIQKNNGGVGYVKLGNGLIIQWGNVHPDASAVTITYPIPFTTNNPIITHGLNTVGTDYGCTSVNKTSFILNSSATSTSRVFRWIAIGY